jgi:hypothetical protein
MIKRSFMCVRYKVLCVWLWSLGSLLSIVVYMRLKCHVCVKCWISSMFLCVWFFGLLKACCIWCVGFVTLRSLMYLMCGFFVSQKFNMWFINCLVCLMCWLLLMCIVCQLCVLCFIHVFNLCFQYPIYWYFWGM